MPKIKEKMPWLKRKEVIIQQDGAPPHTGKGNLQVLNEAGKQGPWSIKLVTQPTQSPDLNINNLGFFSSLKTRVLEARFSSIEQLVDVVYEQYE